MGFADLLERVGGVGRFQALHAALLCLPVLLHASHNLLQNFAAAAPAHRCRAPANLSAAGAPPPPSPAPPLVPALLTAPLDADGLPARCQRFVRPQWQVLGANGSAPGGGGAQNGSAAELQACAEGWEYDTAETGATVVSEWDLVCDRRSLKQMAQTIYMAGVLVGAVIFGDLADRFGRRMLLTFSYLLMAVGGTCAAFAPTFPAFCVFRFLCGMALSGMSLNCFSLLLEWVPVHMRTVFGTGIGYFYTIGQLLLAGVAYLIRDWRWLTLAVSVPFYISFLYSWWVLESARWLVLKGKTDAAVRNLRLVARVNGHKDQGDRIDTEVLQAAMQKELSVSRKASSALDLLRTPGMRRITVCLSFAWFSTSFAYYGLSLDLPRFGVSLYLMQVIFGAVDVPAKLLATAAMSVLGRRATQSGALVLAGLTVLANLLVPSELQVLRTCLAVLGKGCLAASFMCCFLYAGELFPTVIRQSGIGWMSMVARVGSMVSPVVLLLGEFLPWLSGVVYGVAPIISGVIAAFLPETLGTALPDTIQDVEERMCGQKTKKEELMLKDSKDLQQTEDI